MHLYRREASCTLLLEYWAAACYMYAINRPKLDDLGKLYSVRYTYTVVTASPSKTLIHFSYLTSTPVIPYTEVS